MGFIDWDDEDDMEEENWKKAYQEESNLKRDFLYELTSLQNVFYDSFVLDYVNYGKRNNSVLEDLAYELDFKIQKSSFQELPYAIKYAYTSFNDLLTAFFKIDELEIDYYKEIMDLFQDLGEACKENCQIVAKRKEINPCRNNVYFVSEEVRKTEEYLGETEFTRNLKRYLDICKRCPYKTL